jgi:hypothetical protein
MRVSERESRYPGIEILLDVLLVNLYHHGAFGPTFTPKGVVDRLRNTYLVSTRKIGFGK